MKAETLTLVPALTMYLVAIYFAGLVLFISTDPEEQRFFSNLAIYIFFGGIALTICWITYWALHRKIPNKD